MAQNLLTPALNVFEQMALDDVLAHAAGSEPVIRFYHWTDGPAVTFGYSQFFASVHQQVTKQQGPLCRRPTGGGMVFHGMDLTFSLVCESALRPTEIYAQFHATIEKFLWQAGLLQSVRQGEVSVDRYAPQQNGVANGCFANPVQDDLLAGGHKILGGAIRRFDKRILYQGSLQCVGARTNPSFRRAVSAAAAAWLGVSFHTQPVLPEVLSQAKALAVNQYQTRDWTEKFL